MRNPEQKVAHHLEAFYKADAFYSRMTAAVDKAKREQKAGVAYADSALVSAIARANTSPELEKAKRAVEQAADRLETARQHLERTEAAFFSRTPSGLTGNGVEYARVAVVTAKTKHEALVQTALDCQRAAKAKLDAVTETYQEACDERDVANRRDHEETLRKNSELRTTTN